MKQSKKESKQKKKKKGRKDRAPISGAFIWPALGFVLAFGLISFSFRTLMTSDDISNVVLFASISAFFALLMATSATIAMTAVFLTQKRKAAEKPKFTFPHVVWFLIITFIVQRLFAVPHMAVIISHSGPHTNICPCVGALPYAGTFADITYYMCSLLYVVAIFFTIWICCTRKRNY